MVIIFRSVSGGGKTTLGDLLDSVDFKFDVEGTRVDPAQLPAIEYCRTLWNTITGLKKNGSVLYKCSADEFFMVGGEYKFDPKQLGAAHGACLRKFAELVPDPKRVIIVDNTNCSLAEFGTYAALANAYAHELQIITLLTEPWRAYERNKHNVPMTNIIKQDLTLRQSILDFPPWFPQQIFIN